MRNGYSIYYISTAAVRGASPCRTSTKTATPGRTARADGNNGDTVAAGSANSDGIRGGMEQLRPGPLSRSVRPARQPAGRAAMPQTPPSRQQGPAGPSAPGGKTAHGRKSGRDVAPGRDARVAQAAWRARCAKGRGHPAGRHAAAACKTALRPAVRQKIFGRHRRGFRSLEHGQATQEPDRGCSIPVAGAAAWAPACPAAPSRRSGCRLSRHGGGQGAPAQALNGGSGARPDGHHPHGPRPEDVLTAERVPRQRGLAADRAQTVFTSP